MDAQNDAGSGPQGAWWWKIARPEDPDLIAFTLFESGASGVEETDEGNLRAWFLCAPGDPPDHLGVVETGWQEPQDWDLHWRLQQTPLQVSDRLWVVPPWVEPPEHAVHVLRFASAQAFGTGGHESTRLAVRLLLDARPIGARVLDVGSGTGILGLHALQLGAQSCLLLDCDLLAGTASLQHAHAHGLDALVLVADQIDALRGSVRFDLVLANMLPHEVEPWLPGLSTRLAPGARLVLSGWLATQEHRLRGSVGDAGLQVERILCEGEWLGAIAKPIAF